MVEQILEKGEREREEERRKKKEGVYIKIHM